MRLDYSHFSRIISLVQYNKWEGNCCTHMQYMYIHVGVYGNSEPEGPLASEGHSLESHA